MSNLIKINGTYGTRIGNQIVFTIEGAIKVYEMFVAECYRTCSPENFLILSEVEDDMHKAGFTWDQLEDIEINTLKMIAPTL